MVVSHNKGIQLDRQSDNEGPHQGTFLPFLSMWVSTPDVTTCYMKTVTHINVSEYICNIKRVTHVIVSRIHITWCDLAHCNSTITWLLNSISVWCDLTADMVAVLYEVSLAGGLVTERLMLSFCLYHRPGVHIVFQQNWYQGFLVCIGDKLCL